MGLLDSVLGGTPSSSGLSAATKSLLVVLAAKAAKDYMTHGQGAQAQGAAPQSGGGLGGILGGMLGGGQAQAGGGQMGGGLGGLGSILGGGGLGGLLGGGGAQGGGLGGLLGGMSGAGALGTLASHFTQNGHGGAINSWISDGPNQPLAPEQIGQALGEGPLQELEAKSGLPRQTLLQQLAQELPAAVNQLTPNGRLPTEQELAQTVQGQGQG